MDWTAILDRYGLPTIALAGMFWCLLRFARFMGPMVKTLMDNAVELLISTRATQKEIAAQTKGQSEMLQQLGRAHLDPEGPCNLRPLKHAGLAAGDALVALAHGDPEGVERHVETIKRELAG